MASNFSGQLPYPTRKFYETDPRAIILRDASLDAAEALGGILSVGRGEYLGRLLDANSRLEELGVAPSMHAFEPDDPEAETKTRALMTDPVRAAEYAAGFTRGAIEYLGLADGGIAEVTEEHDELRGSPADMSLVHMNAMGPNSRLLVVGGVILQGIENLLDAAAGPSELTN